MADVTKTELAILEQLWDREGATIREITLALYPDDGASHYATVQKLLDRLEAKALVGRRKEGRAYRFFAVSGRETILDQRLRDVADQLCEGSMAPILTHLVSEQRLTGDELDELKLLIRRVSARRRREDAE